MGHLGCLGYLFLVSFVGSCKTVTISSMYLLHLLHPQPRREKDAKTFRTVLPPTFPMVVFPRDFPPALRRLLSLLSSKKGIKEKCEFGSFALLLFFRGVWR